MILTLSILIKDKAMGKVTQIFNQMIPYLLLYHRAKFEYQEAMGSRRAHELKLQT